MPFIGGTNDLAASPEQYLVPTGPRNIIVIHRNEVILTSGSDLNVTAISSGALGNPWPKIIGTFVARLFKGSWRPNELREIAHRNINGNYGSRGGEVKYYSRGREFGGVGNSPGDADGAGGVSGVWRTPKHPTYNNLVPIVYGLRVIDKAQQAQASDLVQIQVLPVAPMEYPQASTASLQEVVL